MRVLVVNRYWRVLGGVEECVRDLQGVLVERGHDVVPFAMANPKNWPTRYSSYFPSEVDPHAPGAREHLRVLMRATTARETRQCLRRLLDETPVDVAHVFSAYHHLGSVALLELRRRGIPVVWSLHDYKIGCPNVICYSERTQRPCTVCLDHRFAYAWAPPVLRCRNSSVGAGLVLSAEAIGTHAARVYRRVPTVVTVLNELQRRAAIGAGVEPSRIHLVPNFIELGDPPNVPRSDHVLFVGRLTAEKGVDVLLRACAGASLAVRVIGDGPQRAELEALARELEVDATFVGRIEREQVAPEIGRAVALAVPSRWPDVAPLVVAEGWAAGTPVVGSDLGGLGALLGEGRGVTAPAGDDRALGAALRSVVADPALGRETVARGRAYAAAEMSRARFVERMIEVYRAAGQDF
jgi:glycosyltransferase involved in cell wall biosynthesis